MKRPILFTLLLLIFATICLADKVKSTEDSQDQNTIEASEGSISAGSGVFQYGTPFEAKQLVEKAVRFIKEEDTKTAFKTFEEKGNQFFIKDLYVFVFNMDGTVLSHGLDEELIGKNLIDLKDSKGKYFIKDFLDLMNRKDSGWIEYFWRNYETQKIEQKLTYLMKVDDNIFIGCGAYYTRK